MSKVIGVLFDKDCESCQRFWEKNCQRMSKVTRNGSNAFGHSSTSVKRCERHQMFSKVWKGSKGVKECQRCKCYPRCRMWSRVSKLIGVLVDKGYERCHMLWKVSKRVTDDWRSLLQRCHSLPKMLKVLYLKGSKLTGVGSQASDATSPLTKVSKVTKVVQCPS